MWENKTVKSLLTEPFKVQKKQGFYGYDCVRQLVIKSCVNLSRAMNKDILQTTGRDLIDMVLERIDWAVEDKCTDGVSQMSNVFSLLLFLFEKNKNIFFLGENLTNTLSQTKVPNDITINKVFLDECLILLPKSNHNSFPCFMLSSCTFKPFDYFIFSPCLSKTEYQLLDSEGFPFPLNTKICLVDDDGGVIQDYDERQKLALNFLLWQQSVHDKGQEVIELDAPTRKMGFGKNSKQLIVPRVIGEGYKPKVIRNYEVTGTHASPTTHWRSGHWRQQPFGKKDDSKYKTIWIEPILVNA